MTLNAFYLSLIVKYLILRARTPPPSHDNMQPKLSTQLSGSIAVQEVFKNYFGGCVGYTYQDNIICVIYIGDSNIFGVLNNTNIGILRHYNASK